MYPISFYVIPLIKKLTATAIYRNRDKKLSELICIDILMENNNKITRMDGKNWGVQSFLLKVFLN